MTRAIVPDRNARRDSAKTQRPRVERPVQGNRPPSGINRPVQGAKPPEFDMRSYLESMPLHDTPWHFSRKSDNRKPRHNNMLLPSLFPISKGEFKTYAPEPKAEAPKESAEAQDLEAAGVKPSPAREKLLRYARSADISLASTD